MMLRNYIPFVTCFFFCFFFFSDTIFLILAEPVFITLVVNLFSDVYCPSAIKCVFWLFPVSDVKRERK